MSHITDINFDDKDGIAGSKLTINQACRNIMLHTNCGIAQAFAMAPANPAKVIGLCDDPGSIEESKNADPVFVDDKFNVYKVVLKEEMCCGRDK